jgi:hypothetical protein
MPAPGLVAMGDSLVSSEVGLLTELAFDPLLQFVLRDTGLAPGAPQSLMIALTPVMRYQPGKAFRLELTGNQRLDKSDIYPDTVGDAARPYLVGMELGHNVQLLLAGMVAGSRVPVRW